MSAHQFRGILFDMDGVLISSTGADERSWQRWARLREMEETFSIQATHGRRTVDTVRALRPDLNPLEELRILEDYDAEDRRGLLVLPGVLPLLAALPLETWAIVTSASDRLMISRLTFAGVPIPPVFVTAERVVHGKPHPEPYEAGARLLGFSPAECLVIEDAPAGIAAGKAAGCKVLAVASSHDKRELGAADWIVPSLTEVTVEVEANGLLLVSF
jgi:sugar-phosphatase